MLFCLLLCSIVFFPSIHSSNITLSKSDTKNKTLPVTVVENQVFNKTKVTLLSEGGSLLPESTVLALPKENHTILMSLDNDLGNNKVKPVVARKGVVYSEDDKPEQKTIGDISNTSTIMPKKLEQSDVMNNHSKNISLIPKENSTLLSKISNGTIAIDVTGTNKTVMNKTKTHKKPLILSYESVANMPVKSSTETLVNNQIQSPTKQFQAYAKNVNSHPGMVMPLVITILLVPMFAVLGYMALRRGQEAWKNRHYKRMDFLLDGMYND